jgi:hypothetical protein
MENIYPPTSAFALSKPSLPLQPIPEHHKGLWAIIQTSLRTKRVLMFADCCMTIYDKRKKYEEEEEAHVKIISLYEKMGKRRFNNIEEFSLALSDIERSSKSPLNHISYNRNHSCTQHSLELVQVKRELKELKESSEEQITSLSKRLSILEDQNKDLESKIRSEIKHREVLVDMLRVERGIKPVQTVFLDSKPGENLEKPNLPN